MRRLAVPVVALSLGASAMAGASASASVTHAEHQVIASAASAAALPHGAHLSASLGDGLNFYLLRAPTGVEAATYARQLGRRPGVFAAEPNLLLHRASLSSTCADPPAANSVESLAQAVQAAAIPAGTATPPIAILDTGVDPNVTELSGRVRPGLNATDGSDVTTDTDGHGTEVAAVAAAAPGRFRGISPASPIVPISIYTRTSESTVDWVVKGIQEAVRRSASVINLSSSTLASDAAAADVTILSQAITAAFDQGVITVAAVGNEGKGVPVVPGDLPHVLTVGSANTDGTRDSFSNFGPWLDLVSPGANLVLPAPRDVCTSGYGNASGTSFSSPAVAGATALVQASNPTYDASQIFDLMRRGAITDLYGPGRDDDSGFGLLNLSAALATKAPQKQGTEIDDDVFWLRKDPKRHPALLRTRRTYQTKTSVAAGKDPQDVFPVTLRKGDTLTATASAGSTALLEIGVWSPSTGSFDIGKGTTTALLRDSGGFTSSPSASYRARRSGTFYVSVEAPDVIDPTDNTISKITLQDQTTYTLKLRKATTSKKKTKKSKKK